MLKMKPLLKRTVLENLDKEEAIYFYTDSTWEITSENKTPEKKLLEIYTFDQIRTRSSNPRNTIHNIIGHIEVLLHNQLVDLKGDYCDCYVPCEEIPF